MKWVSALLLLPLSVHAADTAPAVRADLPDPFSWGSLVQLGLGLSLVVGLILLLGWLVRRVNGTTASGQGMKVLAALPLGQRERAVLVQVGQEQLLLGVAPGRVSLIKHFETPVVDSEAVRGAAFSDRLQQALGRGGGE